jgi:hypothetical protein
MLGVPPKSNGAATNDCVMWRLTNTQRPGFFWTGIRQPRQPRCAGSAVTRGAQHVTAIRWLGVNDHSVPPGLGTSGARFTSSEKKPRTGSPKATAKRLPSAAGAFRAPRAGQHEPLGPLPCCARPRSTCCARGAVPPFPPLGENVSALTGDDRFCNRLPPLRLLLVVDQVDFGFRRQVWSLPRRHRGRTTGFAP